MQLLFKFTILTFGKYFILKHHYFRLVGRVRLRVVKKVRHQRKMDMIQTVVKMILMMKVIMTRVTLVALAKVW